MKNLTCDAYINKEGRVELIATEDIKASSEILWEYTLSSPEQDSNEETNQENNICLPVTELDSAEDDTALMDSGVSRNLFKTRNDFEFLKKKDTMLSTAKSTIAVREVVPIGLFKEAYLLSEASHNLISIGDLDDLDCRVLIEGGIMTVEKSDNLIVSIPKRNNVWFTKTSTIFERIIEFPSDK